MKNNYLYPLLGTAFLGVIALAGLNTFGPLISIFVMLLFPLFDSRWQKPALQFNSRHYVAWILMLACITGLLLFEADNWKTGIATLLLAAIPEEWFFRGYLQTRLIALLANNTQGLLISSLVFSLLHLPTQGIFGLSVFFPSLFYGWIYIKSKDIVLVILLHAISNMLFIYYFSPLIAKFLR